MVHLEMITSSSRVVVAVAVAVVVVYILHIFHFRNQAPVECSWMLQCKDTYGWEKRANKPHQRIYTIRKDFISDSSTIQKISKLNKITIVNG